MNPETNPELYNHPSYIAFSEKINTLADSDRTISRNEYVALAREALAVKHELPDLRADIAYEMVCIGSQLAPAELSKSLKEVQDRFRDLELPDAHVYIGEGLSVEQQWNRIGEILGGEIQNS